MVLDRLHLRVFEDDVGDAGGRSAAARIGTDPEGLRGGVGRLADDVVRAHVPDDGVLHPVPVHDGRDRATAHPVVAVVPDPARGRHHDVRQGFGAQVAAVGLLVGGGVGEQRVGAAVAVAAGPAVAVDVQVGLPEDGLLGAADRDGRGRAVVTAVAAAGDGDALPRPGQQV